MLVITHGLWRRRYGGARDVTGRRVTIAERPFTIVGVWLERWVAPPSSAGCWSRFILSIR